MRVLVMTHCTPLLKPKRNQRHPNSTADMTHPPSSVPESVPGVLSSREARTAGERVRPVLIALIRRLRRVAMDPSSLATCAFDAVQ